jgi:hypothetical protein
MSSLIFITEKEQVLAATDTLATSTDGKPFMFTTKAFIVPHIQMIMCGTGMGGFLGKWFVEVNDRMVIRDVDNLDYHTPQILRSFWQKFVKEYSLSEKQTTTVYHFGFSEEGSIHSFAYRSVNDFVSETLPYGIGIKPECNSVENLEFPKDIKRIMNEQRAIQLSRPESERVYVGGKIQIHHLTKSGFIVYAHDQFDDFEPTQQAIYENYASQKKNTG